MKEELRQEYDNLVEANSEVLKVYKPRKTKKFGIIAIFKVLSIMFIGFPLGLLLIMYMFLSIGFAETILLIAILLYFWCKKLIENTKRIKQKYIENILKTLILKLKFINSISLDSKIPKEIYKIANFRQPQYENYKGNNYLAGKIDNARIEMSNMWTTVTRTQITDGRETTYEKLVVEGFLIVATLENTILDGYIHIFDDKDDSNIFKINIPENKVYMDYSLFEKNFDVYATEPIKAVEILTSDIMQRLIDEKEKMGYKYDITITKNKLIMRVWNRGNVLTLRGKSKSSYMYHEDLRDNLIDDLVFIDDASKFINDLVNNICSKQ